MNSARAEQELRRQLLADYELPSRFLVVPPAAAAAATTLTTQQQLDSSRLLREYQHARDVYLERKFQHAIVKQMLTFDGEKFADNPRAPQQEDDDDDDERAQHGMTPKCRVRPEEWDALRATQDQVQASITETAASYQRALLELQNKYQLFQLRRAELQDLLLMDHSNNNNHNSIPSSNSQDDDDDDDNDIDEEEFSALQERRSELQKRHAALQVQLQTVQQSHDQKVQAVAKRQAEYEELMQQLAAENDKNNYAAEDCAALMVAVGGDDRVALQELEESNQQLQAKVETMTQVKQFYENVRLLMEELSEVRVLSVEGDSGADNNNRMVLQAQLLQQYDVEIVCDVIQKNRHQLLKPVSAKIVSDNTVITGPTVEKDAEHGSNPVVQLQIPPLADLVATASDSFQSTVSGESLRFLLCEIIARIQATQQRVHELTLLQTEALTKIGRYTVGGTANNNSIIEYQEVVCSLNDAQMTAVLRLTPDCPLVPGSVFLDQLVGLGGWETATVESIQTKVTAAADYQSPVALLRAIQAEIQRLQEEEHLVLPETPRLPVRVRGPEWESSL